jgi:hypothetical protein
MKRLFFVLAFFLLASVLCEKASALPRFASRTGAKCQSCHVNPSGGGMRQAFGQQYGRETLPVPTWSDEFALDDFSTKLTEAVSVGADFRTLFYLQQIPDTARGGTGATSTTNNAFWQMQGDVYMNFKLAKKVSIYLDKGIYAGFEIFGLLSILPGNGYIKLGKFVPNYGWKLDDHRTFIRDLTGFSAERGRAELTGGEIGFNAGQFTIMGGAFNAADGFGAGVSKNKALLGRVDGIFKLSDDMNLGLGGNVFTKEVGVSDRMTLFGGLGTLSYKDFSVMGEVDWISNKVGGKTTTGIVTYVEADYVATPGLDVKFIYEFADPDVDLKTGSKSRYSVGLEFFPISGVEVRPLYRFNQEDPKNVSDNEFNLLIHLYL